MGQAGRRYYLNSNGGRRSGGATITVYTGGGTDTDSELYWGSGSAIWNNDGDTASLYDGSGALVDSYSW